jgi:tol-pal system protein YbgF
MRHDLLYVLHGDGLLIKRFSLFAMLLMALAQPAHAGLFNDDEARQRIDTLRQEMDARMQKLEDMAHAQLQLNSQMQQLQQDFAKLRGQLELLSNDVDQSEKRQKDFYVDLDHRLQKLESAQSQAVAKPAEPPPPDTASESRDYETAINALRAGKYVDAAVGFKSFIKTYPKSTFQPSANFWAGSAYSQARDFESARDFYNKVISTWPDDALAPDALLGLSNCQQELGDKKAARATLEALVSKYPASDAAKTAKQRLGKK